MGNEFTRHGCIHHHNYRHLRLFYDYAYLYKNFVEAGIVRILEAATNTESEAWLLHAESQMRRGKKVEPEPPYWVTMSFEQMRSYLIVGCMGEKISEPTLKKHLKKLMERKHILQRVNPDPNPKIQNGPRQYLLNCKLIQKELDKQQKEVDLFLQNLIVGTDEEVEDSGNELIVTTPPGGVKDYPSPKDLGGDKRLPLGQTMYPGSNNVPREDTKFRGGRIQSLGEGGYKVDPPSTYSNYNTITDTLPSSSPNSTANPDDSHNKTQEGEEESSPFSENILQTDDAAPTETRIPVVAKNGASSAIGGDGTQASKQITPTIPQRPTGEKPDEQSVPVKQARCDALAAKLRELRGGYLLNNTTTAQQQAEAIRQLVTQYNDDDIAWIQIYAFRFSKQYRGVRVGPTYASVLLEVAPTALQAAADPEVRAMLIQQSQQSAAQPAQPPAPTQSPVADNPYSLAAQLARQNGRH